MKYRKLGTTSIPVSEIALGTMHFQWIISEQESFRLLDYYVAEGGNFIDTSDMYTQWAKGLKGGEAERIIGKWFRQRKNRDQIFLTTKVRARMWEGLDGEGLSRAHILRACDESLQRLQTDYIDLYMSHWPDRTVPIDETTQAYQDLIKQGKVRFIGCSNYSGKELTEALAVGSTLGNNYCCIEPYYNLLSREPFETDILPLVQDYHLGVTPYSPLAGGFLSNSYRKGNSIPTNERAVFAKENMTEKNFLLLDTLATIGEQYGKTISQVALAWLLHHSWVTAPIVGPETPAQLKENLASSEFTLSHDDLQRINYSV